MFGLKCNYFSNDYFDSSCCFCLMHSHLFWICQFSYCSHLYTVQCHYYIACFCCHCHHQLDGKKETKCLLKHQQHQQRRQMLQLLLLLHDISSRGSRTNFSITSVEPLIRDHSCNKTIFVCVLEWSKTRGSIVVYIVIIISGTSLLRAH